MIADLTVKKKEHLFQTLMINLQKLQLHEVHQSLGMKVILAKIDVKEGKDDIQGRRQVIEGGGNTILWDGLNYLYSCEFSKQLFTFCTE